MSKTKLTVKNNFREDIKPCTVDCCSYYVATNKTTGEELLVVVLNQEVGYFKDNTITWGRTENLKNNYNLKELFPEESVVLTFKGA